MTKQTYSLYMSSQNIFKIPHREWTVTDDSHIESYLCTVMNHTFVLSQIIPLYCHESYLCTVMNHTFVLSQIIPLYCHESYLCTVTNHTFVLSWIIPLYCHESYLCTVMNHTFVLSWIILFVHSLLKGGIYMYFVSIIFQLHDLVRYPCSTVTALIPESVLS